LICLVPRDHLRIGKGYDSLRRGSHIFGQIHGYCGYIQSPSFFTGYSTQELPFHPAQIPVR
jgi:hypothetical protein